MDTTTASRWKRALLAALSATLAVTAVGGSHPASAVPPLASVAASAPPGPAGAPAPVPAIDWRGCRDGYECAKVSVPLDYDRTDPSADGYQEIEISVIRLPAGNPERRIGSLFMNPGGPGGSGVDYVRGIAPSLPLELRGRFDIVGFDPRGIARSTPLRCFNRFAQVFGALTRFAYPRSGKQENRWIEADRYLADACRSHAGPIKRHMSTADVARDMDLLRAAVDDESLSYLGFSYGSELGQTYANLFPDRVRAVAIDGIIDPEAWAGDDATADTVPFGTRLRSATGAQRTLGEFFRLCDLAAPSCAFSESSRKRYAAIIEELRERPLKSRHVGTLRESDVVAITLGAMYSSSSWRFLAQFLRFVEQALERSNGSRTDATGRPNASGTDAMQALARLRAELGLNADRQQKYPNFVEGFPGVVCSDTNNPDSYEAYRESADRAEAEQGYFGRLWNWTASACAVWPEGAGRDRYLGPWTAATAEPVLVVGNYYDPATRYAGAVRASQLLPRSRLLSYAGWGHTAFYQGNYCVDAAITSYLVDRQLPATGTVCQPNGSPFGQPSRTAATPREQAGLALTMPPAVREALRRR